MQNTTCSIGDKVFAFAAFSASQPPLNGVPTNPPQFMFTPDASNPSNPGFTMTGPLTVAGAQVPTSAVFNWGVQIQTLSGAPVIQGLSTTVSGTTTPGFMGLSIAAGFEACDTTGMNCVNLEPGTGSQFCTGPSCTASGNFSPSIAMTNQAFISYFAESLGMGGAVTATGAFYYVSETSVPEPGTLLLLGIGLLSIVGVACRKSLC